MSIFDSLDEEQKDHHINHLIALINQEVGHGALKRGIKEERAQDKKVNTEKYDKSWREEIKSKRMI